MLLFSLAIQLTAGQGHHYGGIQTVPFHYQDYQQANRILGIFDDRMYGPFPIGFQFPFFGSVYDSIYIGTNGDVSFLYQSGSNWIRNHLPDSGGYRTSIYFPKADFIPFSNVSKIYRETIGQAPNRKYIVTYDSMYLFGNGCGASKLNFIQLELHESTGAVRINVLKKDTCYAWTNSLISTFGMQDSTRTIAVVDSAYHQKPLYIENTSFLIGLESTIEYQPQASDTNLCNQGDSVLLRTTIPAQSPALPWQIVQWLRNSVPIPNSADSFFVAYSAGAYSVEMTNGLTNLISLPTNITSPPQANWIIQGQEQIETGLIFNYQVDQLNHLNYFWECTGCTFLSNNLTAMVSTLWPNQMLDPRLSVIITDSSCSDTLYKFLRFFPLSVQEEAAHKIKIYPNPGSGLFMLEMEAEAIADKLKITDAVGREVPFEYRQSGRFQWEIQLLDPQSGLYLVNLQHLKGKSVLRLVVTTP